MSSDHDDSSDSGTTARKARSVPLVSHSNANFRRSPVDGTERYRPSEFPDDPRERAQLLREFEGRASAYLQSKSSAANAQRDGDPMRNKGGRHFVRHWAGPLAEYIGIEAKRSLHKPGKRDRWLSAYAALGSQTLALCTIEAIVSVLITRLSSTEDRDKPVLATKVAREIGHRISRTVQIAEWTRRNPALFAAYERGLNKRGASPNHREVVLAIGLNKKARNPETASPEFLEATASWPEAEAAAIGQWLLWVTEHVTKGAVSQRRRTEGNRKGRIKTAPYVVELAPKAVAWLKDAVETQAFRATNNRAMICPPRPWHGPRNGGYLLGDDLRVDTTSMIRGIPPVRKAVEEALEADDALGLATPVFSALNALQETPFAINEAVHDVAREAATSGLKLDGLPDSFRLERVPKAPPTGDGETDKALFVEWKRKQAVVENRNARNISKVLWSKAVLTEAAELHELESEGIIGNCPLWFAHRVDSRGRMYPAGNALNPQGSDLARNLLRFHRGKPIGDGRGPVWLAAQVAKSFGHDKLSWDDRVAWTETSEELIRRIAEDALGNRDEWDDEADKLWGALAAAREWTNFLDSGRNPSFNTTLPIFIDGTCNGLQHYAALSGDLKLARLVNLEHTDQPEDIYREVAVAALADIRKRAERGTSSKRRPALLWLRIIGDEPPRDLAKKTVMAKAYGGTYYSIREAVREFFDKNEKKRLSEWGGSVDFKEAADLRVWLEKRMDAALKDRAIAADKIMKWLQKSMRLLCDHSVADKIDFRTPAGFPWKNLYYGHTERDVSTRVNGKKRTMTLAENDTSKFKRKDAVSAVAPNFVHSLDATAMMFAVNEAHSRGVTDMMAIHDCIGGLAPDMDITADAVRVGFVKCHEMGPLERFREAVLMALPDDEARAKLRPLPERGEFDVRRVLGSRYFFC
jgi:DNA-directed RNA polymerase, mitochondrial